MYASIEGGKAGEKDDGEIEEKKEDEGKIVKQSNEHGMEKKCVVA